MKIIVIGAVAAGTSAAAKAKRNLPGAEIIMYEKDNYISYAACGLPYYVGDIVEKAATLAPRDVASFEKSKHVKVKTRCEVTAIDANNKTVTVHDLDNGCTFEDQYDKLVIATGAKPMIPPIEGVDHKHVFTLRNIHDGVAIKDYTDQHGPQDIVVVGSGFIGLEMVENLKTKTNRITVVEMMDKLTPVLDTDMADVLEEKLVEQSIKVLKSHQVTAINAERVTFKNGESIKADLVILATGIVPNTELAKRAGVKLGIKDAIIVDDQMRTNFTDIYACGDCIQTYSSITNKPVYHPLGTTANKTGRIAGDVIGGGSLRYRGNLMTGIFKVFDVAVATTGLNEQAAKEVGFTPICKMLTTKDKPSYFNGKAMTIKAVVDSESKRLLGVQIVGQTGVDKRIDIFATLITYKATIDDLFHLDLAYAPPFSPAKDPVHYTGMIF